MLLSSRLKRSILLSGSAGIAIRMTLSAAFMAFLLLLQRKQQNKRTCSRHEAEKVIITTMLLLHFKPINCKLLYKDPTLRASMPANFEQEFNYPSKVYSLSKGTYSPSH